MARDFVMCEFGSDHDVTEMPGGFYQNLHKSLRHLKMGGGETIKSIQTWISPSLPNQEASISARSSSHLISLRDEL
jgi:hypothetical protein